MNPCQVLSGIQSIIAAHIPRSGASATGLAAGHGVTCVSLRESSHHHIGYMIGVLRRAGKLTLPASADIINRMKELSDRRYQMNEVSEYA